MNKFSFIVVLSLLTLGAVNSYAQLTPIEFNNKLAALTDSLEAKGGAWGNKFAELDTTTKHFVELIPIRENMMRFVDDKIKMLTRMKDVEESQKLRLAFLDFMKFEKHLIEAAFTPIESLDANSTEEQFTVAMTNLDTEAKKEADKLAKIAKEQELYAKDNGFVIEGTKDAELKKD